MEVDVVSGELRCQLAMTKAFVLPKLPTQLAQFLLQLTLGLPRVERLANLLHVLAVLPQILHALSTVVAIAQFENDLVGCRTFLSHKALLA